jgi:hypothetical protein
MSGVNSPPISASTFLSVYRMEWVSRLLTTRVVSASYVSLIKLRISLREVEGILNSDFVKKYEDTFIKVKKRGSYKESDIDENHIRLETSAPGFVSDFEQQLDSQPGPADDVC